MKKWTADRDLTMEAMKEILHEKTVSLPSVANSYICNTSQPVATQIAHNAVRRSALEHGSIDVPWWCWSSVKKRISEFAPDRSVCRRMSRTTRGSSPSGALLSSVM